MSLNRRAGLAFLSIDGVAYDVVSGASYNCNAVQRESLTGQSGVHGYSEMPTTGSIGATIRDAGVLTVAALNQMTNVTVILKLANGKLVYGEGMWSTEVGDVDTQEGTIAVKFEGANVLEQLQ
ncbi:phage tail protein [Thioclava sp. BHET1]|nr:phage tail protein [Thioclava sp. BHET1]